MELNVNNKCRACLVENDTMLSLFEVYEHELTLAMILQSCVSTEVSEDDGLPSRLCDSCILVLTQFYNFTVVYEQSEKQLQALLRKGKKVVTANESEETKETTLSTINEQTRPFESETSELISSDSNEQLLEVDELSGMLSVEVNAEDVGIVNCNASDDYEFYEFKSVADDIEGQGESNIVSEYEVQEVEAVHEFKKEVISPDDLHIDNDNEYLEIHISDSNEPFIKQEDDDFHRENPTYEEITKYECTVCGEAHLYAASFQQHMRVKHQLVDINCDDYASRIRIKLHQKVDTSERNGTLPQKQISGKSELLHKCKFCNKEFHLITQLQQHAKLHDANKKYVCEVCGARFIRKTYLDDHMEGHSTERKHVCKFCGKAFRRRTVLRAHKRVHTHPNYYVCELCGRAFTNSSTLKTHKLLIHVRERNFQCVICNLTFPLKSTLNKHVLRHQKRENGEKGFNCTQCEMQYRDKSSLKRHIETKHQGRVQLISCPDCPKKYTSKANLMKHRRRHHEPTNEDLT